MGVLSCAICVLVLSLLTSLLMSALSLASPQQGCCFLISSTVVLLLTICTYLSSGLDGSEEEEEEGVLGHHRKYQVVEKTRVTVTPPKTPPAHSEGMLNCVGDLQEHTCQKGLLCNVREMAFYNKTYPVLS